MRGRDMQIGMEAAAARGTHHDGRLEDGVEVEVLLLVALARDNQVGGLADVLALVFGEQLDDEVG